MIDELTILVGGIQGEGIISIGINLMKVLSSLGYYTYGQRTFSSRIKGGNTTMIIHVSLEKTMAIPDTIDMMLVLDEETLKNNYHRLDNNGLILYDNILSLKSTLPEKATAIPLPVSKISKEEGSALMKSTCGLGFICRMLDINQKHVTSMLIKRFHMKGKKIINQNLQILERVFTYDKETIDQCIKYLNIPMKELNRPLMIGNDSIAFGALMAGCRFVSSYPITPASEIMEYLGKCLPSYGGLMLQVEDEIAAVNMAIGASFAGVRSITATSGPGLSLMLEGIGLAGMTETPLVVVNSQRVGPSTGLPTKHEQSDLFTLYYGGHGEIPLIILSPSTIEDCFHSTIRAFNLAEKFQCPVILLLDLTLSLSPQTIDEFSYEDIVLNRGKLVEESDLRQEAEGVKPYLLTEDGISPRILPGVLNGHHHITGLEHNEFGLPTDNPLNRRLMMEKRMQKLQPLMEEDEIIIRMNNKNNILFLTFGSPYGILERAVAVIGNTVDYGYIKMIKPLPKKQLIQIIKDYDRLVIVENNYSQQLATVIKAEIGNHNKIKSISKYDGTPFTVSEIIDGIEVIINEKYEGL